MEVGTLTIPLIGKGVGGEILIVGVLQTAINAVTLALVDAGIPMNDYICATSAGLVDDKAILGMSRGDQYADVDLNSIEEADIPHCTIATLGASEKITLIQVFRTGREILII
jgi:exosome complex component RRP41